ncbi:MAG TPA: glucose 1-dehydrogenase [Ktedonobacterales bacterium]|jgi:NAD(P)-dependent dehydrogenase (short-subunit alcohol dehydrogenase family)
MTDMAGSFSGKVVVVTGGGSGMGRAAALAFGREGARVMVADIHGAAAEATAAMIREAGGEAGGEARSVAVDVSQADQVEAMIAATMAAWGRLDCAFNNAGINIEHGPLVECSEEEWERVLAVNLKGVWLCMKAEIPRMLARGDGGDGRIVNNASIVGLRGSRNTPAYVASKHGIVGLTRAAALEYGQAGIRVNAVCPGAIKTQMYLDREGDDPANNARIAAANPLNRLGSPEDVAGAVLWLCSDAASFVTGHCFVVDGGEIV